MRKLALILAAAPFALAVAACSDDDTNVDTGADTTVVAPAATDTAAVTDTAVGTDTAVVTDTSAAATDTAASTDTAAQ
jgi:hypothetical protein